MSEVIDELLGFIPVQVSKTEERPSRNFNANLYRPRPAESKSQDGVYRAKIKVIYNPFDIHTSCLERQSYWLEDERGGFEVVSSLTNNDRECPVFKAFIKCFYSKDPILKDFATTKQKGGKELFNRRFGRYVVIQVLEDENHPELQYKYMFWKCPEFIWKLIDGKIHPSEESKKASIPVTDFLFGKALELEVVPGEGEKGSEKYNRDTSYATSELTEDVESCVDPEGNSFLTDDQQDVLDEYVVKLKKIWKEKDPAKRETLQNELASSDTAAELRKFYREVIEKIKAVCPNIVDELGFKPWSDEVTARVDNWIKIILSGKDPKGDKSETTQAAPQAAPQATPQATPAPNPIPELDTDDDLPF